MDPDPSFLFTTTLETPFIIAFLVITILLFCSALVSGAEVALLSLTPKDIEATLKKHPSRGRIISKLLEKPKKLSVTLLIANNLFNIGVIVLFLFVSQNLFPTITSDVLKFIIDVLIITFLILLFGEVFPKVYASKNNNKFAILAAYPVAVLDKLLSPISLPMRKVTLYLHNKLGKQKTNFSISQLSQALELTDSEETSSEEQKILEGIVSFGNTDARQIMSPRMDIFALEINESFSEIYAKIIEKGFSRIPVYRDNIDHIEGVLVVKDLLRHINDDHFDWKSILREAFFIPENKKIDNLLKDFQDTKRHLAIVVDEYGGTSGLITLEDIIEEIVGDISDEFDEETVNYTKLNETTFVFEGKTNLKDFYKVVDVDEELFEEAKGETETLAGFILEILGGFPKKQQEINFENCNFTIEAVDKKRIKQIKVTFEKL